MLLCHRILDTMPSVRSITTFYPIRLTPSLYRNTLGHLRLLKQRLYFTPLRLGPIFESYTSILERHEHFTRYS